MDTMKIVVDRDCMDDTMRELFPESDPHGRMPYNKVIDARLYEADSKEFSVRREANKIMNDYAVTKLPFVLLINEKGEEYAAVYSEEGPVTIDRINRKL